MFGGLSCLGFEGGGGWGCVAGLLDSFFWRREGGRDVGYVGHVFVLFLSFTELGRLPCDSLSSVHLRYPFLSSF